MFGIESAAGPLLWGGFLVTVVAMLLVDLFVFNKEAHKISLREATKQSIVWISLGILVGVVTWILLGANLGAQYFTGYVIEKSLSVDNIFVWGLVLSFFAVPQEYRHRVLFWGIFGALLMRFIFIITGVSVINQFSFVIPLLGLVLIYSAVKILRSGDDDDYDVKNSKSYKFFTKHIPTTKKLDGQKFFSRIEGGVLKATPLFLCLLVVEVTDVIFAVDSVPAILAISSDPFVIFASNAMAILGLRSLFFLFDAIKDKFEYLGVGVGIVLAYVGTKMIIGSEILPHPVHIPTFTSLAIIVLILGASVVISAIKDKKGN